MDIFLTLYFTTYLSWSQLYFYSFFIFEYFDSFAYYAACWFPLKLTLTPLTVDTVVALFAGALPQTRVLLTDAVDTLAITVSRH